MFKYWWDVVDYKNSSIKSVNVIMEAIMNEGFLYQITLSPKIINLDLCTTKHKYDDFTWYNQIWFFKNELDAVMAKMIFNV